LLSLCFQEGDCIEFGASTRKYNVRNLEIAEKPRSDESIKVDADALRELPQSFGGVKRSREDVENDEQEAAQRGEGDAAAARKKVGPLLGILSAVVVSNGLWMQQRQAEIAAMTAAMMQTPATTQEQEELDKDAGKSRTQDPVEEEDPESESSEDDNEGEGGAKDDVAARYAIPMALDVTLSAHSKAVSCIAIDPPGARVATGSFDYHVKLWDFAGMARSIRPFRDAEPDEGHPIVALSHSPSGDRLLVATSGCQPKVLSREGVEELQFAKGDMYVVEMNNTTGHTHTVTGAAWHPQVRDQMISSSLDGTVRVWNLGGKQSLGKLTNASVLKVKSKKGKRSSVTTCRYSLDGALVACGTMDGQVQCIDPRKAYAGAALTIRDAHAEGGGDLGVSSVRFSPDGRILASRACSDDTVKLWDLRKTQKPLKVFSGIEGVFGTCNVAFNATGTCLAAGTCVRKGKDQTGQVHFLDVYTPNLVTPIASVNMQMDESAVCVEWHHGINQLFVGSSSSSCRVLYDPVMSKKGVLLSATKKKSTVQSVDYGVRVDGVGSIHNPHALPMYRDEMSHQRKYQKARADPKKSKAPEKPLTGPGMGGRISGTSTFTQYFMSNHIKGSSFREEDPREAILKYAKTAEENPQFTARAYAHSQPTGKIDARYGLASQTLEEEKLAKEEEHKQLLQP
jgi:WD repeat-containing protein 70